MVFLQQRGSGCVHGNRPKTGDRYDYRYVSCCVSHLRDWAISISSGRKIQAKDVIGLFRDQH